MINGGIRNLQRSSTQANSSQANSLESGLSPNGQAAMQRSFAIVTGESLNRSALRQLQGQPDQSLEIDTDTDLQLPSVSLATQQLGETARIAVKHRLSSSSDSAANSSRSVLDSITEQFQQRFATHAEDPEAFHSLMKESFGNSYDESKAELIRQKTLQGDFSWMPDVQLVEGSVLADVSGRQSEGHGLGAYSAESDTIFLSRDLLNTDPAKAEKILSEEVGHSLDAKLNIDDTAGDEGEIFARLSHGESVSADELRSLKAENDAGTIVVNGKEIEVEYGWNPLKKVGKFLKKGVSSIGRSIKKGVKSIGRAVKKGFTKLVNSRLIGVVLQVAKFIPIPVVQGIAHIVNIAKMGYSLYQGVKHRSIGAIVGGIAGVASGVAKFGGFIGSNGPWVSTAANLAEKAGVASTAYRVLSEKDIGAALRYISGTVGTDNSLADVVNGLTKVNAVYEAQKSGDFIGAINAGSLLLQDFTDSKGDELLQRITHNATTISKFKEAYEKGDFVGALNVLGAEISADQGEGGDNSKPVIDALRVIGNVQIIKTLMDDGDYAAAALRLIETATLTTSSSKTREALEDAARTINAVDLAIQSGKSGEYKQAMDYAEIALGRPLDDKTRARVSHVYENARHLNSLVRSIDSSDIAGGIMSLRMLLANPSPSPLTGLLNTTGLMMKESEHLLAAIDRKDYRQAVSKASEIARLLPRGSELASTFDTLSMLLSNEAWVLRERNNPEAITGAQH